MDDMVMDGMTFDMEQEARERLRSVFPDCFSDGALDIDKLLSLCGTYIDNDFEKYKFAHHNAQFSHNMNIHLC